MVKVTRPKSIGFEPSQSSYTVVKHPYEISGRHDPYSFVIMKLTCTSSSLPHHLLASQIKTFHHDYHLYPPHRKYLYSIPHSDNRMSFLHAHKCVVKLAQHRTVDRNCTPTSDPESLHCSNLTRKHSIVNTYRYHQIPPNQHIFHTNHPCDTLQQRPMEAAISDLHGSTQSSTNIGRDCRN